MPTQTATYKTGTREEWLAARLDPLKVEKELTRRSDELAKRRQLPWVRIALPRAATRLVPGGAATMSATQMNGKSDDRHHER
jgi:hypothetical protein